MVAVSVRCSSTVTEAQGHRACSRPGTRMTVLVGMAACRIVSINSGELHRAAWLGAWGGPGWEQREQAMRGIRAKKNPTSLLTVTISKSPLGPGSPAGCSSIRDQKPPPGALHVRGRQYTYTRRVFLCGMWSVSLPLTLTE